VPYFAYSLDQVTFFLRARVPANTPKLPPPPSADEPLQDGVVTAAGAKRKGTDPESDSATVTSAGKRKAAVTSEVSGKRSKLTEDSKSVVVMTQSLTEPAPSAHVLRAQARGQLCELVVSAVCKCLTYDDEKFFSKETLNKLVKPLTAQLDLGASLTLRLPSQYRYGGHRAYAPICFRSACASVHALGTFKSLSIENHIWLLIQLF